MFTYYLWIKAVKTGSVYWGACTALSYFYMVSVHNVESDLYFQTFVREKLYVWPLFFIKKSFTLLVCVFVCLLPIIVQQLNRSHDTRAENFRMVDIGINAWSSLFDNLKINIIFQDYLKSVGKTIKFNHLRNCSSQSEKSGQPIREQKYSHWRKQLTDIQGERKRVDQDKNEKFPQWIFGLRSQD